MPATEAAKIDMANQTMEWTSLASQPQADTRQAKVAPPIIQLRRPGRPGRLGWAGPGSTFVTSQPTMGCVPLGSLASRR